MSHPDSCGCATCEGVFRVLSSPIVEREAAALAGAEARVILHPLLVSRGADPEVEAIAARAGGRWVVRGAHVELAR